jgi:hypothetical protein
MKGFFPGSVQVDTVHSFSPWTNQCRYLISCWYTRFEVQKRLAAFYSINVMANGFGSVLAYGCMQLSGRNGWLGWRWFVHSPFTPTR